MHDGEGHQRGRSKPATPLALCIASFAIVAFLAMLPHLGVLLVSFSRATGTTPCSHELDDPRHFESALRHSLTVPSIANSLKYASLATLLDIVLGIAIAYVIVRSDLPGARHAGCSGRAAARGTGTRHGVRLSGDEAQEGKPFSFLNPILNDPAGYIVIAYSRQAAALCGPLGAVAVSSKPVSPLRKPLAKSGLSPCRTRAPASQFAVAADLLAGGLLAFSFAMLEVFRIPAARSEGIGFSGSPRPST